MPVQLTSGSLRNPSMKLMQGILHLCKPLHATPLDYHIPTPWVATPALLPLTSMLLRQTILPAHAPATCTASIDVTGTPRRAAATACMPP
jgi:hypothetical protein